MNKTMASLEPLLASLDPDRERAIEEYLRLWRTLMMFFERNGSLDAEETTSETIARVIEKIINGKSIEDIFSYSRGVAKNVLMEERKKRKRSEPIDDLTIEVEDNREDTLIKELKQACLDKCLDEFPEEDSVLLRRYYLFDQSWLNHLPAKKREAMSVAEKRMELARLMGMTRPALTQKIHNLRQRLDLCVWDCVRKDKNKSGL